EPKTEEQGVVTLARLPGEEIRLHVLDVAGLDAAAIDREHFQRSVDRGEPSHPGREEPRKQTGAAGELKSVLRMPRFEPALDGAFDFADIGTPARVPLRTAVVAPGAKPPFVVLPGPRPVVVDLLVEDGALAHGLRRITRSWCRM